MSPAPDLGGVTRTRRQQQQGEPRNHPRTPQGSPQPFSGALFPLSEPGMRRSGGVPNPHYQPVPARLRQYRAATERVVHRWQACGWE